MKAANLRSEFIDFFSQRGHREVPSGSLLPNNDPTLLFTNAGMNQFKDALLGRQDPGYKRAVSAQRCVRAGGKHNDLENVGYTARHHTFFEMLGNFSFGDYFKEDAIVWAWEFCTSVMALREDNIWVTVHPEDEDARSIWENHVGLPSNRVISLAENFWSMGETGPCGPCSELFYDHGDEVFGGPPGSPDEDGDRFVEFWNLVFPQFDRQPDGELESLPQVGVDTGLGLERMAAIMQGVHSNYEIDLFTKILLGVGRSAGLLNLDECLENPSVRIIADHIRSSAFLIADGLAPGNEDRGYVLRRIIRRGLRHGHKLGFQDPFFHLLVRELVDEMGSAYPVLAEKETEVKAVLLEEEERFSQTLSQGMELLNITIEKLKDPIIPGDIAFKLYDTYGFPVDLTNDIARERELSVDIDGFDQLMGEQKERGRATAKFNANLSQRIIVDGSALFVGHESTSSKVKVTAIYSEEGKVIDRLSKGKAGILLIDSTPFYAESGGQVGDSGLLIGDGIRFEVSDTQASGDQYLHIGSVAEGAITLETALLAEVDAERRSRIAKNHSATHLMHAALIEVLGDHVEQKGSLVDSDRFRFDFSHSGPVTAEQTTSVTNIVNERIQNNVEVFANEMSYDKAIETGAMALFGEKYGDNVRVLTMGKNNETYSTELCGGTHVERTGDIGCFAIISESGIASGVRRIEAMSGESALNWYLSKRRALEDIGYLIKASDDDVVKKVESLISRNKELVKQVEDLQKSVTSAQGLDLLQSAAEIGSSKVVVARIDGDMKKLLETIDSLKSRTQDLIVVLGGEHEGKANLAVSISKSLTGQLLATELLDVIATDVGARGGGRPDLARAGGGKLLGELDSALSRVIPWITNRLEK